MENHTYRTKDIALGAFFLSKRKSLIGLIPDQNYYWFEFEDKRACEKLATSFWSGRATASARELFSSFKTLKELIYSQKNR